MNDTAPFKDQRAVGDGQDLLRMLLDNDGGESLLTEEARERGQQFLHDDRRQPLGRLVEQQKARICRKRTADRQHLLLAARQRPAGLLPTFLEAREEPEYALQGPRSGPRHGGDVLLHGERAEDVALLRHPADAERGSRLGRQGSDLAAGERDRA